MLQKLFIQNYAIIEEIEIDFSKKLNIITGETGAGKSIIAGALGLILGDRADSSVLVEKEKKCIVEGTFGAESKPAIKKLLAELEIDPDDELIIRREIAVNGKSRAFINDTPVTLAQLNQLSSLLVDLHQQFDTLQLNESDFQMQVIDALAGHYNLVTEYQLLFTNWQKEKKELEVFQQQKQQFDKEADYNRFQFNELEEANFKENELEEIDQELKVLSNSEGIKNALSSIYFELAENDKPIVQQLKTMLGQLEHFAAYHPGIATLIHRLETTRIEIQDIAGEIDNINSQVNYDPEKIEQLNDRLSVGYKLLKKHGVQTTNELLEIKAELEKKLQDVLNIDEAIRNKEKKVKEIHDKNVQQAEKISEGRKKQIKPLEQEVNKLLFRVGMPNAKLKIEVKDKIEMNQYGTDSVEFLFDANKTDQFLPVRKIASGGELSRLMLCIKSLVAKSIDLPTLIFDEIDTGISGEAAKQIGLIMKELASKRQVISITHQPQIAGKADAHFFVYKEIVKDSVKTNIRLLTTDERITTIAKMLSGEKPTAAAMENAREMLMN